jgi:hypothetical protein
MEDHNQSRNQTNSADEENLVELSADMALPDQKKHKIIDLVDDIDNPENKDVTPSPETLPKEAVADIPETTQTDELVPSTPAVSDVEDILSTSEKEQPAAIVNDTTDAIEDEVDAAFDAVAVQPEPTLPEVDDLLFDELSDITQEVDDAVGKSDGDDPTDEDLLPPSDAEPLDDEDLSAQAAELAAAMAGDYDDDNDVAPPPGVAQQQDLEIPDEIEDIQDDDIDDIIDLIDVVDPSELDHMEAEATEENDIIELTQIVDKEELESLKAKDQNGQAEVGTPSLSDQTQAHDTSVNGQIREDELSLSDIDDGSDFTEDINASIDTDDLFDPAELDGLFDDDISEDTAVEALGSLSDDTAIASDPTMEDADGLFDIVDDFNIDASSEKETHEDIESIPSLEETDGSQIPEKIPTEAEDTAPIEPVEEKIEDQEQVIQLADVLSALKTQQPNMEHAEISPEEDKDVPSVDLKTQGATTELDVEPSDESVEGDALFEDKQIEAAVEKIIRTKYADKLEQLIASAVEKAVTQEIENIKRSLSDMDEPPV